MYEILCRWRWDSVRSKDAIGNASGIVGIASAKEEFKVPGNYLVFKGGACRVKCVMYVVEENVDLVCAGGEWFTDVCGSKWLCNQVDDCTETRWIELEGISGDNTCVVVINCGPEMEPVDGNCRERDKMTTD